MQLTYVPRWPNNPGEWMEVRFENGQLDGVIIRCPECNHNIRVYSLDPATGVTTKITISPHKALSIDIVQCPYQRGHEKCTWFGKITGSVVERVNRGQAD